MRHLLFIALSSCFATFAIAGVVLASPPAPAPAPTRVILMPAPPPPTTNADAGGPPFVISKTPPDPQAMVSKSQWVFDLRYDKGSIYLLGVHPLDLPAPQATPRVMGRFAIELFEGPTLIERVRFDFPMLGGGEGTSQDHADAGTRRTIDDLNRVSFDQKLTTRIGVIFPQTRRGTRAELVDRATGSRLKLPWPPSETTTNADGGR